MKRLAGFALSLALILGASQIVWAKKNKDSKNSQNAAASKPAPTGAAARVNALSKDDQALFDSLSQDQRDKILKGQIDVGFNAWMVKLALGEPLYGTEHHPVFVDYEEVWLYAKPEVTRDIKENKIIDPQTNWPTIHRQTTVKTCQVSDFFVLWDRGVVAAIHPDRDRKVHGSCTIEKEEAYLPIVDGKPVEPAKQ